MINMEIIIPTWNRDEYLDRTLSQFAKSPFLNNKITIIDNNSTDNTSQVCEKYKSVFPNLKIIKNNKNIGLSANILRSFEIAKEKYLWLVGDNDNYDFTDCSELIDTLENSDFDIIVTENILGTSEFKATNMQELFDKGFGNTAIQQIAILSTYILKTELYTEECIQEGYNIAKYLYPQFGFIKKALEENFSVYILNKPIRLSDRNPHVAYDTLDAVTGWISSNLILEKKYRKEGIKYLLGKNRPLFGLIGAIIAVKARKTFDRKTLNDLIISVIRAKNIVGVIYSIIMLIVSLIPSKICEYILNKFYEIHEKKCG